MKIKYDGEVELTGRIVGELLAEDDSENQANALNELGRRLLDLGNGRGRFHISYIADDLDADGRWFTEALAEAVRALPPAPVVPDDEVPF